MSNEKYSLPRSGSPLPNVIVFGETGAGKSSVINMLRGGGTADVSDRAKGVTFSSTSYEKAIRGSPFRIFDTVGLNEGSAGTMAAQDAIQNLYQLIGQLTDGVNLLVYVMRAPRIKATAKLNYELFYEIFCDKKVPIVIVVTGLEERDDMDGWWDENKLVFDEYNMSFDGHACITATRGKLRGQSYSYGAEYEDSKSTVERLIHDSYTPEPWKKPSTSWFASIFLGIWNLFAKIFGGEPAAGSRTLYIALRKYAGLSDSEARAKVEEIGYNY